MSIGRSGKALGPNTPSVAATTEPRAPSLEREGMATNSTKAQAELGHLKPVVDLIELLQGDQTVLPKNHRQRVIGARPSIIGFKKAAPRSVGGHSGSSGPGPRSSVFKKAAPRSVARSSIPRGFQGCSAGESYAASAAQKTVARGVSASARATSGTEASRSRAASAALERHSTLSIQIAVVNEWPR